MGKSWIRVHDLLPPEEQLVEVQCDDFMGECYGKAMRKNYKRPPKGKSAKGFKKGWRWLNADGDVFYGPVEAWRALG